MEEASNQIEPRQAVRGRWKRQGLIALLLASPLIILIVYSTLGHVETLAVAIFLNFSIRRLKRSQPPINVWPFFWLSMFLAAAYIVGLLSLSR